MIVFIVLCSYFLDIFVYAAIVSEQNVLGGGGSNEILLEVIEGTNNYRVHGKCFKTGTLWNFLRSWIFL